MSLNIKNPETHRMAKELASLRSTSVAQAVAEALREAIERDREPLRKADRILVAAQALHDALPPEAMTFDVNDLYDEMGLPK